MPFCPLCEKEKTPYKKYSNRPFAACPNCRSLERHRVFAVYLKKLNLSTNDILHIAPEICLYNYINGVAKSYICGDLFPEEKKYKIMNVIYMDATNIPYDNRFHYVIASHVLEHIPDDFVVLTQIYKSLVKGGIFLAMIPQKFDRYDTDEDPKVISNEERTIRFGQSDHVRAYGLDFSKRLKQTGFYVKIHYIEGMEKIIDNMEYDEKEQIITKENIEKYGLLKNDILYECIKKN